MTQNRRPSVAHCLPWAEQFTRPVRAYGERIDLQRKLVWINAGLQMSGFLGAPRGGAQHLEPRVHHGRDTIAHRTRAAIKFKRGCGKEAASRKDAIFHMAEPAVAQLPQPRHPLRAGQRRSKYMFSKHLLCHFNSGKLQFFFVTEVANQSALAHRQFVSPTSNGETAQTFDGCQTYSSAQDPFACADTAGATGLHLR